MERGHKRASTEVASVASWRTSGDIFKLQWQRSGLYDALADQLELVRVACRCACVHKRAAAAEAARAATAAQPGAHKHARQGHGSHLILLAAHL